MMALSLRPGTAGQLAHLLQGVLHGTPGGTPVHALCDDSRDVVPRAAFFARAGAMGHGNTFALAAVGAGASVVVSEQPIEGVAAWIQVSDVPAALLCAADAWYGAPQHSLVLCAVTGTKGKTTTTQLAGAALRGAGLTTATFGTVEHDVGDGRRLPSGNTTPGVLELRRLLALAREQRARHAVLEVSSHGLAQGRTQGLDFAAAAFTNLGRDHMDYHQTPEAYFAAKSLLFSGLPASSTAVLNREDAVFERLVSATPAQVLSYGLSANADLYAKDLVLGPAGTRFTICQGRESVSVNTRLVGRHNVLNLLAAVGLSLAVGVPLELAAQGAAALGGVRGRLERVGSGPGPQVFVDYAHTAESLREVLGFLREIGSSSVTCVIGCGGDRDRFKRPLMAKAAVELSERAIFTSDNPRNEDPEAILRDMLAGLTSEERERVVVLTDRRAAIRRAVGEAARDACVLIAGKGHESYQIVGERRLPFDDVREAASALDERHGREREEEGPWGTPPGS